MNLWYVLSVPALVVMFLTALSRLHDIKCSQRSFLWNLRRAGFTGCIAYTVGMLALPFTESASLHQISWLMATGHWGIACVWMTTPNMVPWFQYVTGKHRMPPNEWKNSWAGKLEREYQGIVRSFRNHQ